MSVPFPVELTAGTLPLGFEGTLQDLLNAFADGLTATLDGDFITGQVGGTTPTTDVGPWVNGEEWWFWNPTYGKYMPTQQGVPVGVVAIWGGQGVPANWLLCDGREVSRTQYNQLYVAIGETWGPGDRQTTFNLPPGGVFYVNAPGWTPDPSVPVKPGYAGSGINGRGGQQTVFIASGNLPPLHITIPFLTPSFQETPGGYGLPAIQPYGAVTGSAYQYPVTDKNGLPLGLNRTPLPTVPPYAAANYIIKWQ